ncbi:hypothetical protein [Nocardia sp. CA-290969]|uniref:hypothetical protein n=1 Tax=Nocardia sp. CA-290969 TaxID=3239986 RepID=UPI003D907F62
MNDSTARSSVVPGVLGGLSVLATTLLLELGRNLVMNSFGESDAVRLVSSGLRWLAVLVVALAMLYSGYRFALQRRAGIRLAVRRNALAMLDGARPAGSADTRDMAWPTRSDRVAGWHSDVVAALRELPVRSYDTATLHAVLAAVAAVHDELPGSLPGPGDDAAGSTTSDAEEPAPYCDPRTAAGLRQWLEYGGVLDRHGGHHVLAKVPATPAAEDALAGVVWQAALFALLSHCADQASSWAVALTTIPFAPGARRWFTVEEPYLRELVRRCALRAQGETDPSGGGSAAWHIPSATVVQLVRIADALDIWYAHQVGMAGDRTATVARSLEQTTADSGLRWFRRLMAVRRLEVPDAEPRLPVRDAGNDSTGPASAGSDGDTPTMATGGPAGNRRSPAGADPRDRSAPVAGDDSEASPAGDPQPALSTALHCVMRRRATGLAARSKHRAAWVRLRDAATADELNAAVRDLRAAWWRLPREDVTNQVLVLTNLAVAHIAQGRLDAAADRLELAAVRAAAEEDDEGRALVYELDAAVRWARGEPRGALRSWQRALGLYEYLGDPRGIAGCLHHLGSALELVPEHADLVLGDDPPPAAGEARRYAREWRDEAAVWRRGETPPQTGRRPLRVPDESGDFRR